MAKTSEHGADTNAAQIKSTPARQGARGKHVLVVLVISTVAAIAALLVILAIASPKVDGAGPGTHQTDPAEARVVDENNPQAPSGF